MQNNSNNLSLEDLKAMAGSPAGQQLLAMLRQSDPAILQQAMARAASGDMSQAKQVLAPLLASEEAQKLLKQLGG